MEMNREKQGRVTIKLLLHHLIRCLANSIQAIQPWSVPSQYWVADQVSMCGRGLHQDSVAIPTTKTASHAVPVKQGHSGSCCDAECWRVEDSLNAPEMSIGGDTASTKAVNPSRLLRK